MVRHSLRRHLNPVVPVGQIVNSMQWNVRIQEEAGYSLWFFVRSSWHKVAFRQRRRGFATGERRVPERFLTVPLMPTSRIALRASAILESGTTRTFCRLRLSFSRSAALTKLVRVGPLSISVALTRVIASTRAPLLSVFSTWPSLPAAFF